MSIPDDFETRIAAARVLYEGTHGMTMVELAEITGISKRTLTTYSRDANWRKLLETKSGETTPDALAARAVFERLATEQVIEGELVTNDTEVLSEELPSEREALLARHREEWKVPRGLASEAVKMRTADPSKSFERAKLAKITAEALTLVQNGERRAHGIDRADGDHTLIVERGK